MKKSTLTKFTPQRVLRYGNVDLCPLDGDTFVLQFLNTHSKRGTADAKNYLKNYDEFIVWCYEINLIDEDDYNILICEGYCYAHEAESILNKVLLAREMLYEIICCMINNEPLHPITLNDFNMLNDEANKHLRFEMTPDGFQNVWFNINEEMAFPLWRMMKCAIAFLTSGDIKLIKKCSCGNFFLDRTKNGIKQYCNPLTCGSIKRSKQYYQRMRVA